MVQKRAQESLNSPGASFRATSVVQGPHQESHSKFRVTIIFQTEISIRLCFTGTVDWLLGSDQQMNTESWFGINTPRFIQTFKNLYGHFVQESICYVAHLQALHCPCPPRSFGEAVQQCCTCCYLPPGTAVPSRSQHTEPTDRSHQLPYEKAYLITQVSLLLQSQPQAMPAAKWGVFGLCLNSRPCSIQCSGSTSGQALTAGACKQFLCPVQAAWSLGFKDRSCPQRAWWLTGRIRPQADNTWYILDSESHLLCKVKKLRALLPNTPVIVATSW